MDELDGVVRTAQLGGNFDLNAGLGLEAAAFQLLDARRGHGDAVIFLHAGLGQRFLKFRRSEGEILPDALAHVLDRDLVVHGLIAHQQLDRRLSAAVERGHVVEVVGFGVGLLHGGNGGFADSFQLRLLLHGLGAAEDAGGEVVVFFIVQREFFLNQAYCAVGAVDERGLVGLRCAGQQCALGHHAAEPAVAHHLGVVGVAGAVVQLQHAVERHAVGGEIHDGQIARRDGLILQHLLKDDARDAAGQVDEILILRHLLRKSGVRQETAVFHLVAGERAFQRGGVIFVQVGVHVHGAVGQHRLRCAGVEQMQHDLIDLDFHCVCSFGWDVLQLYHDFPRLPSGGLGQNTR